MSLWLDFLLTYEQGLHIFKSIKTIFNTGFCIKKISSELLMAKLINLYENRYKLLIIFILRCSRPGHGVSKIQQGVYNES
jgi:hypothetical protein